MFVGGGSRLCPRIAAQARQGHLVAAEAAARGCLAAATTSPGACMHCPHRVGVRGGRAWCSLHASSRLFLGAEARSQRDARAPVPVETVHALDFGRGREAEEGGGGSHAPLMANCGWAPIPVPLGYLQFCKVAQVRVQLPNSSLQNWAIPGSLGCLSIPTGCSCWQQRGG